MVETYIPYPDIDNKDFYQKIYSKKEFFDTKANKLPEPDNQSDETMKKLFPKSGNFILNSQQTFLRNFISGTTPYRGILVFHGTGTGKTCASISIAERFRELVQKSGKKILIIASNIIQNEFKKTIFDKNKEMKATSKQIVQCTGKTYSLHNSSKYISYEKQEKQIQKLIHDIYEFYGRTMLTNKLKKDINWKSRSTLTDLQRNEIKKMYSNKIIIIDEVHKALDEKDGSFRDAIESIIENADNIRLILMSATPMVNSANDILFSINLLRLNDRRPIILFKDIFTKEENFIKNGEILFRESIKGYISYVRGGETPRFPYRLIPEEAKIPNSKYTINGSIIKDKIQYTKLILCPMDMFQYKIYKRIVQEAIKNKESLSATDDTIPNQAGIIIYPTSKKNEGTYGSHAFSKVPNETTFTIKKNQKNNKIYTYSSFCKGFLLKENIGKYSSKLESVLENIIGSKGISFVYSTWIDSCLRVMAFMLEENGFTPAIVTGKEYPRFSSNTKKKPICYKCFKEKHDSKDHVWYPAKYILLTGTETLTPSEIAKITGHINREDNKYGKLVKVLLGSVVSAEGVDFKRIRQVHIMDGWYNKARIDQVEGRAIRNGSHRDLLPEERNVDIYKYCITNPSSLKGKEKYIETIDEYYYRISENKDKKIKKIEYILKQSAIDCLFQKHNNIRNIQRKITLENSKMKKVIFTTGDKPFSRECNYMKSCSYTCAWEPKKDIIKNKSTYTSDFVNMDIDKVRKILFDIYQKNSLYHIDIIFNIVKKKYKDIEPLYIYLALESVMNRDSIYSIKDMYNREGYLVERDRLYIFQPNELYDENAPLLYKKTPITKKPLSIPFIFEEILEKKENKNNKKADIYQDYINKYEKLKNIIKIYTTHKSFKQEILELLFSSMSDKEITLFCKKIFFSKNVLDKDFIDYFINKGNIYNNIIITKSTCIQIDENKKKKNIIKWSSCNPNDEIYAKNNLQKKQYYIAWNKIPSEYKITEDSYITKSEYIHIITQSSLQPLYIGHIETIKKFKDVNNIKKSKRKYLKIFDFTSLKDTNKKSKRTQLRGKVCSSFQSIDILIKIKNYLEKEIEKLSLSNFKIPSNAKNKKETLCIIIEFLLRVLHKKTNKIWIIDISFEED